MLCVDRAVLIAVLILVKGETISSSAKARDYKAPTEIRGRLHSGGCSWKELLPKFFQGFDKLYNLKDEIYCHS